MKNYTGTLLIASPHLMDPNFRMTVVLVIYQNQEQIVGVVLNRASQKTVATFLETPTHEEFLCKVPVYIGGPVLGPLTGLLSYRDPSETSLQFDLHVTTETDEILRYCKTPVGPFRVFLGQAGWTPSQLDQEIEAGIWYRLPAAGEDIFSSPEELWARFLHKSMLVCLQRVTSIPLPSDPMDN